MPGPGSYFKPRNFESVHNRTIYAWLGIGLFKKLLPNRNSLAARKRDLQKRNLSFDQRFDALYAHERKTRAYEIRHWLGMIGVVLIAILSGEKLTTADWIFLIALNTLVNIYPIFLQRHNRIRILRILEKAGMPSPYRD